MPYHISSPSARSLYVEVRANGYTISNATAFVVQTFSAKTFLVTNRHVVTGRHQDTNDPLDKKNSAIPDEIIVWHNSKIGLGIYTQVRVPLYSAGREAWIEHPTLGAHADMVAIQILEADNLSILPYRTDALVHNRMYPSQRVSVVGFPFGQRTGQSFAVWATGFVASEPEMNHGGRPVFLIDCRTRQGQSGSPVIYHTEIGAMFAVGDGPNETQSETEFLGIYSGRINEDSDIGIVWKSYAVAELIAAASMSSGAP